MAVELSIEGIPGFRPRLCFGGIALKNVLRSFFFFCLAAVASTAVADVLADVYTVENVIIVSVDSFVVSGNSATRIKYVDNAESASANAQSRQAIACSANSNPIGSYDGKDVYQTAYIRNNNAYDNRNLTYQSSALAAHAQGLPVNLRMSWGV